MSLEPKPCGLQDTAVAFFL